MPRTRMVCLVRGLLLAALALAPAPLLAQQPAQPAPSGPIVVGKVVDAGTGKGLPYALVSAADGEPHVIADSAGVFRFPGLPFGVQNLTASQLGYSRMTLPVPVAQGVEPVEFKLFPDPVAIEGIKVMGDRFRGRRNALPVSAQAFDHEKLERSPQLNVMDFLANEGHLSPAMCPGRGQSTLPECFNRRGAVVFPEVYLDEAPLTGGMSQLSGYHPDDLYLVEVISNGLMIRVYTKAFMDRLAQNPHALEPIILK